jgi:DNA-binding XRE family transcriptional regulator
MEATMVQSSKMAARGEPRILSFIDSSGRIAAERVAAEFGMSKSQLAETAGLARETLYRSERIGARKAQGRLREMLEIISRISDWAGGEQQAMAWYRAQPLPAFGGRTAEALVKDGKAAAVRDYLDHMALGGFA